MKCPKCNSEIAENAKFCPECGEKLADVAEIASAVVENATPENQTENAPNEKPSDEATEEKAPKQKSNKKKVIIIALSAIVLCGIIAAILLILNPSCMFGHRNLTGKTAVKVTCTSNGRTESICDDCGACVYSWVNEATGHDFGEIKCNEENTCVKCGEKKFFEHGSESVYSGNYCLYCDGYKYNIILPETPQTLYHYYSNGSVKSSIIVTEISVDYGDGITVSFTAKRTYHAQNSSEDGRLGWRLYSSDGKTVLTSGIAYTNGSIAVGESSKGSCKVYTYNLDLESWKDYKLVITGVQN